MRAFFKSTKGKLSSTEAAQAPPPELKDAQLAAASYGQRTGGDSHDYFRVNPSRVLFVLLDVAGRMDQKRAVVSAAQSTFRTCGQELLNKDDANEADAMIEICVQMEPGHPESCGACLPLRGFCRMLQRDPGHGLLREYRPHLGSASRPGRGVVELGATGLPLGLFSHSAADASIVALEPGATLLLVSRGLVEANRTEKEFGLAQVKELLLSASAQTAEEICASVIAQVQQSRLPSLLKLM